MYCIIIEIVLYLNCIVLRCITGGWRSYGGKYNYARRGWSEWDARELWGILTSGRGRRYVLPFSLEVSLFYVGITVGELLLLLLYCYYLTEGEFQWGD